MASPTNRSTATSVFDGVVLDTIDETHDSATTANPVTARVALYRLALDEKVDTTRQDDNSLHAILNQAHAACDAVQIRSAGQGDSEIKGAIKEVGIFERGTGHQHHLSQGTRYNIAAKTVETGKFVKGELVDGRKVSMQPSQNRTIDIHRPNQPTITRDQAVKKADERVRLQRAARAKATTEQTAVKAQSTQQQNRAKVLPDQSANAKLNQMLPTAQALARAAGKPEGSMLFASAATSHRAYI